MSHPPRHVNPASLRIGVYAAPGGSTSVAQRTAVQLALLFRDYGGHRVIGHGLWSALLPEPEWKRWESEPIADAPDLAALTRHADLIYLMEPESVPQLKLAASRTGTHPTLVLARELHLQQIRRAIRWARGWCPVVYQPVIPVGTIDELACPGLIWAASDSIAWCRVVPQTWTPIINTVPIIETDLSGVSETGLLLSPEPSGVAPGVVGPLIAPDPEKGHTDAAGS